MEAWREVWATARRNKLRTLMTAAGVFWGTFMLLLMLGFGGGLEKGIASTIGGYTTNAAWIWGQRTSLPYRGLKPGREIDFTNADMQALLSEIEGIEYLAPRAQLGGHRGANTVSAGIRTGSFGVAGDVPAYFHIQPMYMVDGRFLHDLDIAESRKVAVIGTQVASELFDGDASPVGSWIQVRGMNFLVVGVFGTSIPGDRADRVVSTIHIPLTTFQAAFNQPDRVGWLAMTGHPEVSAAGLETEVRALLMARHGVHPDDRRALGSHNSQKEYQRVMGLFRGIRAFVWLVGLATLASGVVGVSNIMLIVVKERTREIGVRRALGATPVDVFGMILQEAMLLTLGAGCAGLLAGLGTLELISGLVGPDNDVMGQPQIDAGVTLGAMVALVVAGGMAGLLPAQRAVEVHPVDALRAE